MHWRRTLLRSFFVVASIVIAFTVVKLASISSYGYALQLHRDGHYFRAFPLVFVNAVLQDDAASALLGTMYLFGQGVSKDGTKAEYWLSKAGNNGVVLAQSILGTMYATGQAIPQDIGKAQAWLTKAASAGDKEAEWVLRQLQQGRRM